jgi:hypothetical protein
LPADWDKKTAGTARLDQLLWVGLWNGYGQDEREGRGVMRVPRLLLLTGIAAAVLALHACDRVTPRWGDAPLPAPVPDGVTIVVDRMDAEAQTPIVLRVGQPMAVTLTSNFTWQMAKLPHVLRWDGTESSPTTAAQREGRETGGATWFSFSFEAVAPGDGELVLVEAPGWEPERQLQTVVIPVRVEP